MIDRKKVIEWADKCTSPTHESEDCNRCPYHLNHEGFYSCIGFLLMDTVALLKKQEAKPLIHVHKEYPKHDWVTNEKGEIYDFAWNQEYCNGPMCKRCYYAFCIHCEPNGWNKKPCIVDFFKCPNCGEEINKNIKFCSNCGQAVKWDV